MLPRHFCPIAIALSILAPSPAPAQQHHRRELPHFDTAAVARGHAAFQSNCGFCHGEDATGNRAPDLVRSAAVSHDTNGDVIGAIVHNGRPDKGMSAFSNLTAAQISDIAAFLHFQAGAALHSGHVSNDYPLAKLLTGNAAAGKAYFNGAGGCSACHSPTGDLAGIARKYTPIDLQQRMLWPAARRGSTQTAKITLPNGQTFEGAVTHIDEFDIAITDAAGYHSWPRSQVKIELHDPLAAHRALMEKYTDAGIHNLFAYLETLTEMPRAQRAATPQPPSPRSQPLVSIPQPPAPGWWPTYNGDYSGRRYSPLSQIDQSNVNQLTPAWVAQMRSVPIKSTPLEVNGILYLTTPDNVWALDARTGRTIWHYFRESQGDHIGQRGVGMYGDWLFFETPDCHLISLNAKDGSVRWDIVLADPKLGYFSTMAPLVVRNHVLAGVSGDVTDIPGFLDSIDPETGKVQWRWYTEPKPGQPGSETWPKGTDAISHGGGMTWMTGTYDPSLNLVYWGTGNPNPVLDGDIRKGDNLYTCSIVALDPDTGKLKWHFQPSPHDTHDWDAVQTLVLFDDVYHGVHRKLLAQASRNGYFFVLDRTTGENILTEPFIGTNWVDRIDARGEPRGKQEKEPKPDGVLVSPGSDGATNWLAPSFDPASALFYVSARRVWSVFYMTAEGKPEGWAGRDRNLWAQSQIEAIDYKTGHVRWKHAIGGGTGDAGILTTAGHLLFTADNSGNLLALDPATGKTLWHVNAGGRMVASPMTYELNGRQYLLTPVDNIIYAWALPRK